MADGTRALKSAEEFEGAADQALQSVSHLPADQAAQVLKIAAQLAEAAAGVAATRSGPSPEAAPLDLDTEEDFDALALAILPHLHRLPVGQACSVLERAAGFVRSAAVFDRDCAYISQQRAMLRERGGAGDE